MRWAFSSGGFVLKFKPIYEREFLTCAKWLELGQAKAESTELRLGLPMAHMGLAA